MNTRQRTETV